MDNVFKLILPRTRLGLQNCGAVAASILASLLDVPALGRADQRMQRGCGSHRSFGRERRQARYLLLRVDGGTGPVSRGAALDVDGATGAAEWTNVLADARESVNFTVAIKPAT